jgi:hypothetical protein
MECEQLQSGLVVPKEKPKEPSHQYGPLEVQDETQRKRVKEAMGELFKEMGLHGGGLISFQYRAIRDAHRMAFGYLESMLLGDEAGDHEVLC